ncbi:hypothetical protein DRQ50_02935 [bacterium]|nr:MAG: hypothetical protein DRQ50_02935 [bacterium]
MSKLSKYSLAVAILLLLTASVSAQTFTYPHEESLVEVMFIQESAVRLEGGVLVDLAGLNATDGVDDLVAILGGGEWIRLVEGVDVPTVDMWQMEAEMNLGEPVYNLNNAYRLVLFNPVDVPYVADDFMMLPGIELAYPVALPPELPLPPDYSANQGYLQSAVSAPAGVDANYAWTQTGGDGTGVTVCDIEYSWNTSHNDITKAVGSQINTNNVGDPFSNNNHGTAVIGELVSDDNSWGTVGVSKAATLKICGCYYGTPQSWNVAGAIALSVAALSPGDVILLEQQTQWGPNSQSDFMPVEWYPVWYQSSNPMVQLRGAIYAAIQNAVGNGYIVVEAAGNGGYNMDTYTWYGDSGAIMVGAGGAYTGGTYPNGDLQKLSFSNYGARVDVHGWGENVYTTGYGSLFSSEGTNRWYTSTFNGTSSASPIVAGAAACLQGWYLANVSTTPLTPTVMRSTLITTGTAQISPPFGNIGPRPDLAAAIASIPVAPPLWTDVTAGPLGNTGLNRGVAWADYDRDGDPDLYVTDTQGSCQLLRNDITVFTDVTAPPVDNLAAAGEPMWGDHNNDGMEDIYLANMGSVNRLFDNQGMMFMDLPAGAASDPTDGAGVQWVDMDLDGHLDLCVTTVNGTLNRVFANPGDGSGMFVDMTMPPMDDSMDAWDSAWADYDNDGDPDCYLVRLGQPNMLLRNDGGFNFMDVSTPMLADAGNGYGACWADADGDGWLDLYLSNRGSANRLYAGSPGGIFTDVTMAVTGQTGNNMGSAWGDYDNDGDPDLFVCDDSGANKLLRNDGGFIFTDDTNGPLGDTGPGQGCAFADYDLDGDLDLFVVNAGTSNRLYRNDINNGNNWLHLDLAGYYANASAIGARVRIVAAGVAQIREIGDEAGFYAENSLRVEFGLGAVTMVDSIQIAWPGGTATDSLNVAAGQIIQIVEPILSGVNDVPSTFRLLGGVPNPFNPETEIRFVMPGEGPVTVTVYDAAGRRIRDFGERVFAAGAGSVTWRGKDDRGRPMPSGIYFAKVRWDGGEEVTKLALVK